MVIIIIIAFSILYIKQKKTNAFLQQVELIDSYNRPRQMASSYEYVSPDTIQEAEGLSEKISEDTSIESSKEIKEEVTLEDLELSNELLAHIEAHEGSKKKESMKKEQKIISESTEVLNIQEEIDFIKRSKKRPEIPVKDEELEIKIYDPIPSKLKDSNENKKTNKKIDSNKNKEDVLDD